jgi:hypothetical protein
LSFEESDDPVEDDDLLELVESESDDLEPLEASPPFESESDDPWDEDDRFASVE